MDSMDIGSGSAHAATRAEKAPGESSSQPLPLSYARTMSWISLVLILITTLGLSFFIASSVREILLRKQEDFTRLLVENLNSQIFRRFALPTIMAGGRIALRQPTQYEHLDRVVRSVIEGLPVERLRIFDFADRIAYSTDRSETGKSDMAPANLAEILDGSTVSSETISTMPPWQAWFHVPLEKGTFVVRALYPLHGEPLGPGQPAPIMGALELTQDITDDYERVMAFQGIIVVMCLLFSVILFGLLLILIQRAEKVLAERLQKNKKLEDEIHSNEKFVSMGRVVASIAHEIRNPLGIIRSSAEFLQKRNQGDTGTTRMLGAIYDESVRLSQTVNDFLDYARPRKPKMECVNLSTILNQVISFQEGEFRRHSVRVENGVSQKFEALGDKDLLYRAFYNIMMNGLQAMEGPGLIRIRAETANPPETAESRHEFAKWIRLDFHDSGPGFDESAMQNLLDPFFTTKDGGTGLGLPIVHSIITGHGGCMKLANSGEGGAVVSVWLPACLKGQEGGNE